GDQPCLHLVVGEHAERMAHHGGARDLAERADMRQAGRSVAGLEDHLVLRLALQARDDLLRLLERPGVGLLGELAQRRGGWCDGGHAFCLARSRAARKAGVALAKPDSLMVRSAAALAAARLAGWRRS